MTSGRIQRELQKLEHICLRAQILSPNVIEVEFKGPSGTPYATRTYTLKFILKPNYPFTHPEAFFRGLAPDHPFYRFDLDDDERHTRTTNLAHTDFGLYYRFHTPNTWLADYVARIQESIEPSGAWMADFLIQG